jgi:hypothetical protein
MDRVREDGERIFLLKGGCRLEKERSRVAPEVLGPFASVSVPLSVRVPGEHRIEEGCGAGEGSGEVGLHVHGVSQAPVRIGPGGWGRWQVGG